MSQTEERAAGQAGKPPLSRRRSALIVATLGLCAGIGTASLTLVIPSLPAIGTDLGISATALGITQSVFLAGIALPQLVFGTLADRFGHRKTLIAGLLLFMLGSLLCLSAQSFGMLLSGRLLQAVGAASGLVTSRALVHEIYAADRAAAMLGYVSICMMVIPMFAPAIGGQIQASIGWHSNFALLVAIALLLLAASAVALPRRNGTAPSAATAPPVGTYIALLKAPPFHRYIWHVVLAATVTQCFFATAPFVMERHYHLDASVYGTLFTLPAFGFMAGAFLSGRLAERLGVDRMVGLGTGLLAAASLLFGLGHLAGLINLGALFGFVSLISLAQGILVPSALVGATGALGRSFGSASGLAGFLQFALAAIGVQIAVPLITLQATPGPLILLYIIIGALSFGCLLILRGKGDPAGTLR